MDYFAQVSQNVSKQTRKMILTIDGGANNSYYVRR